MTMKGHACRVIRLSAGGAPLRTLSRTLKMRAMNFKMRSSFLFQNFRSRQIEKNRENAALPAPFEAHGSAQRRSAAKGRAKVAFNDKEILDFRCALSGLLPFAS